MDTEVVVETGTQENETQPVHMMSKEQLDGLINNETPAPAPEKEPETQPAPEPGAEKKEETPAPAPDPEPTAAAPTAEELLAENERLKKRVENQNKFLTRQATEVGLLRKRSPAEEEAELQRIRDLYIDDPVKGLAAHTEYIKGKENEELAVKQHEYQEQVRSNYETVQGIAPDFDTHVDDIVKIMREDGAQEGTINNFLEMPYAVSPATLLNLYKRVGLTKENGTLKSENERLKKEVEELKAKPATILENIEKAANRRTITAASAGASSQPHNAVSSKPIHMMSRDELKQLQDSKGD